MAQLLGLPTDPVTLDQLRTVANLAGVSAAIAGGVFAASAWRRERRRDEVRDEERRSEQAGKVAAWPHAQRVRLDTTDQETPDDWCEGNRYAHHWDVLLLNASALPVYDVQVQWHWRRVDISGIDRVVPVLVPSSEPATSPAPWHALQEWVHQYDISERDREPPSTAVALQVSINFTDASGRRWKRTHAGELMDLTTKRAEIQRRNMRRSRGLGRRRA